MEGLAAVGYLGPAFKMTSRAAHNLGSPRFRRSSSALAHQHRTVPDGFVERADIPTGWVLRVSQLLDPVTPEPPWKRLRQTREHGSERSIRWIRHGSDK